jgi:hypothetical protein
MRLGLLARAEDRGLGVLSWETARHLHPDRTLVVDMGPLARGFPMHLDRYPGATVVPFVEGCFPERIVREWLDGLDVVYCVDADTQVFTNRGWLSYAEVQEGDLTLGIDALTHLATWQPVERVHVFPERPRRMLSIESRDHSSLTTENHRWYVEHQMNGPKPHHRRVENRVRLSKELTRHDRIRRAAPCVNLPSDPKYTDALVELVAWFYTEGHLSSGGIGLTQSERVNPDHCDRIRLALTALFGPASESLRHGRSTELTPKWREYEHRSASGCVRWRLNRAASEPLFDVAPEKVVSGAFIRSLTRSQLQLFVDVSMAADNAGRSCFGQKDPRRVEAFELACILLGIATSRYQTKGGIHIVSMHKTTRVWLGEARREWVEHDGIVWCPVTASGSWLARRHGTLYFTGNTAETPYDFRLLTWAQEGGTATVLHTMPEFFHWTRSPDLPRPTVWWNPTTWRSHLLPDEVQTVPVPVAMDRFDDLARDRNADEKDAIPTFLHVAGHRAMADRNGTRSFLMALRHLTAPMRVLVLGQDRRMPSRGSTSRVVTVESHLGGVEDYWRLYEGADVLVMPRRYGGLSLPCIEAMGAGLAVVMTDTEPQASTWPVIRVATTDGGVIETGGGTVSLVQADPRELARFMDALATTPALLDIWRDRAREWALANSWDRLRPLYEMKLAEACVLAEEQRR